MLGGLFVLKTPEISSVLVEEIKSNRQMDKATEFAIKKFVKAASVQTPGFISAYLFGSYATNNQRHESDIDIAIVIQIPQDSENLIYRLS